ncbi:MAG: sugar phosphate isomerase/epimerase [Candidatus Omnitrophica bacterium]|nr:sugar phosphate isomerase/epimerase [Candidatus Omnitrophota bacterium]MCM8802236.1 sugar phosphate isomerase/epimerase [Candidatus Omnitrophota bacterium]
MNIKIAIQLYSVRHDCEKDLYKVLKEIAKIGYEGVEFAGYYNRSAEELKKMLNDLNLKVAGTHIRIDTLLGDELKKTIEFNKIIGNKYLIVPILPEEMRNSREKWIETAKLFNKISELVRKEGMFVGYHNHAIEFQKIDNEYPWDIFFKNTVPEVIMQLDTGNAMKGGVKTEELIDIIKRYPKKALTVHLKEFSSKNDKAILGEGDINWKEFIRVCKEIGNTEWYIIEQESYTYTPIECIKKCYENLKGIIS